MRVEGSGGPQEILKKETLQDLVTELEREEARGTLGHPAAPGDSPHGPWVGTTSKSKGKAPSYGCG